jgi:hypothetical protein
LAHQIFWEEDGAYRKFAGHVSDDELVGSVAGMHGDRRFDDLRYVINDFLGVESFDVTEENVLYIAAIDGAAARSNPHIRIALVTVEPEMTALAMRYIGSPWTVYPTQIFHSLDAARTWIVAGAQPASKP